MAELTITAADVKASSNSVVKLVQFGETVTQGMTVYEKAADLKYWKGLNTTAAAASIIGIALTPNVADGWGFIQTAGDIDLGTTLAVGATYAQASTAGKIEPEGDVATTEYVTLLGSGKTTALLKMNVSVTGISHA